MVWVSVGDHAWCTNTDADSLGTSIAGALGDRAKETPEIIDQSAGIYLMIFMSFLFIILIGAQRTAVAFMCSLSFVVLTCLCFSLGLMLSNTKCLKVSSSCLRSQEQLLIV